MNNLLVVVIVLVFGSFSNDARMVCKQKEFGRMEVLICPPNNDTEKELRYCCSNNGLMACCDYDDYQQRHKGLKLSTTCVIIIGEVFLVVLLVFWCYICRFKK